MLGVYMTNKNQWNHCKPFFTFSCFVILITSQTWQFLVKKEKKERKKKKKEQKKPKNRKEKKIHPCIEKLANAFKTQ